MIIITGDEILFMAHSCAATGKIFGNLEWACNNHVKQQAQIAEQNCPIGMSALG
jgi:hypothetical protein